MPSSFFIVSFDMVSFFIESLDIVSFFMPSSLPILSWAKAAGASARLSERTAAEIPSERREVMGLPFEGWLRTSGSCRPVDRRPGARLCYAKAEIFSVGRIFAIFAGVFLPGCDTISPAMVVLFAPAHLPHEPTVRRNKSPAMPRPTIRLEKQPRHPG